MCDENLTPDQESNIDPNAELGLERFPHPQPRPLPPDWWRCLRFGPVSGRYYGMMTSPNTGKYALDLRVDIDPSHANAPVMDRVSGDIYQVYRFNWGGRVYTWKVYRHSWIVDKPKVKWSRCAVGITGKVRFWKGVHLATRVEIAISWRGRRIGPAKVKFTSGISPSGATSTYRCTKKSNAFRELTLEVDVCDSVNTAPIMPSYDTHSHANRPVDLPQRTLTIEESYDEAGIDVTVNPDHTIIDDSATQFNTWSVAELHDAMEQHFSRYPGTWPKWHMWCLMAGTFDSPSVGASCSTPPLLTGGRERPPIARVALFSATTHGSTTWCPIQPIRPRPQPCDSGCTPMCMRWATHLISCTHGTKVDRIPCPG